MARGAGVLEMAETNGEITEDEAHKLVPAMLAAGVDTTVNGIGAALYALARYPTPMTLIPSRALFGRTRTSWSILRQPHFISCLFINSLIL
jgi:Cytochrome P450